MEEQTALIGAWRDVKECWNSCLALSRSVFCPSQPGGRLWWRLERQLCPFVLQWGEQRNLFHVYYSCLPKAGESVCLEVIVLPSGDGDDRFPCRTGAPGVRDRVQRNFVSQPPQPGEGQRERAPGELGLAVDRGTVCFGFPRRADYPHEAMSELFQDHPLCLRLRLVSLFCLFGLFQQTLARRFQNLLCYKSIRQPPASTWNNRRRPHEQVWDLWGQFGFGCSLLLYSHFCCIGQMHQRLPLWTLLEVFAANALTNGWAHDLCLVALAVVLQAAWSFAVAAFAVSTVRLALFAFTNFRFEGLWISVQTRLYGFETFRLVFQVIEAVIAVTVIAELSICKAVTV